MNTYPVRFKLNPDHEHLGGYILQYQPVIDITNEDNLLKATFPDAVKLRGAFLKAGLYLHSFGTQDTGKDVMPDPNQDYEVTDQMLRDLGFDIPVAK